jgi:hypothetical protein
MGELFCDSQRQKEDAGIRRTGADKIAHRNLEAMEKA